MFVSLLILSVLALLFAVPIGLYFLKRKQRRDEMRRAAQELGFTFSPKGDVDTFEGLSSYHLFAKGTKSRF